MTRRFNDIFKFKQFQVDQTDCAMKISSDATIFGAYVPTSGAKFILDIGTGTGLLALMLGQRAEATSRIDAIEIDPGAFKTAEKNARLSPFAPILSVIHSSLQEHASRAPATYDLIVCNPPFFQRDLVTTKSKSVQLARHAHDEGLDFTTLITCAKYTLAAHGRFWVLLPAREAEVFRGLAGQAGLHERDRLNLLHKSSSTPNRTIAAYALEPGDFVATQLVRFQADNNPTDAMRRLLAPYMLHF